MSENILIYITIVFNPLNILSNKFGRTERKLICSKEKCGALKPKMNFFKSFFREAFIRKY